MKVIQLNQSDLGGGGAAIASYRLHQALQAQGIDSRLFVGECVSQHPETIEIEPLFYQPRIVRSLQKRIMSGLGLNYLHIANSFFLPRYDEWTRADVIHMHNLHSGYFNYLALPRITRGKKVIFTLHDMWAFTGHCAYSNDCERWRQGCGKCPYRESYPAIVLDGSAIEWRLKNWAYSKCSMVVVTPSKWLADLARQSILGRFEVHNIANGLDLRVFKPHDQEEARIELGLPRQATVLMFSANKLDNKRKGAAALIGALWKLPESMRGDVCLLTFGDLDRPPEIPPGMQAVNLGYVREDAIKAKAYSAADVFILPSLADNAPIVIQESLACGTPAIAFPVGGIPEMVIDGETGLLTDRADEQSLYDVLRTALSNVALLRGMRNSCRRFAVLYFDATTQATKYMRVYESAPHQAN